MCTLRSCIRLAVLAISLAAVLALPPAHARTWRVPSECSTIPAGLDSAAYGDTVLVGPGLYPIGEAGPVHIGMKAGVGLVGEAGAEATILELCGNYGHVVYFHQCEGEWLRGFTIRHGTEPDCSWPTMWYVCGITCYVRGQHHNRLPIWISGGDAIIMATLDYWGGDCPDHAAEIHGRVIYCPWTNASHTTGLDETYCSGAASPSTWGSIKAIFK